MAAKYDPLSEALTNAAGRVEWALATIDAMVGGLPPSARTNPTWWANTWVSSRVQAHSWLRAGYHVENVDFQTATVVFAPGAPARPSPARVASRSTSNGRAVLDGVRLLGDLLRRAGYPSVMAAVAEHAVFLHPDTVAQTAGRALFPVVRNMMRRGEFDTLLDGRRVLLDDNSTPTRAFLWAAGRSKGLDVQFNHVWSDANDPDAYTALWNLCATPAFLAKTTDGNNHPDVVAALRYRAWELFGYRPATVAEPAAPVGYERLAWAPHPSPVASLEHVLRTRLTTNAKSRPALAARAIGWLYSQWQPDPTI